MTDNQMLLIAFFVLFALVIIVECMTTKITSRQYEITRILSDRGVEAYTVTKIALFTTYLGKLPLYRIKNKYHFQRKNIGYFKFIEYPTIRAAGMDILHQMKDDKITDAQNKFKSELVMTITTENECKEIINS